MTELFEPTGEHDWRLARGRTGLLAAFNDGLLLTASDLHVASRVGALGGEDDERVLLAVALAVRAVRRGSVCLSLAEAPAEVPDLPWPEPAAWASAVRDSRLVEAGVLRWDADLVYLDRYHRLETQVRDDLAARAAQAPPDVDESRLGAAVGRYVGSTPAPSSSPRPRRRSAAGRRSSPAGPAPARRPPWRGCWRWSPTRRRRGASGSRSR